MESRSGSLHNVGGRAAIPGSLCSRSDQGYKAWQVRISRTNLVRHKRLSERTHLTPSRAGSQRTVIIRRCAAPSMGMPNARSIATHENHS